MKYFIDKNSSQSAYIQLYHILRNDIVSGAFPFGSKLPSKRMMAEESDISVITVEHAYSILCDEGYAEARQRSGYFVIYKESDFISSAETAATVSEISDIAVSGENGFPFSVLAKTMRRVLNDYGDSIMVKSHNFGCLQLRSAISAYLARSNGMKVKPEQIIIGAGAEYLYSLIVQLLGKNRIFALENPSYSQIKSVYRANGVKCDMLEMGPDGIRTSELKRTGATVLHVTPFNSYPSGITARASKRYEYLQWAKDKNGYIIEDNFDSELTVSTKSEDTVFSLSDSGNVIYINTFSHTIAPSMRAGYMVLPQELVEKFHRQLGFYSCTVPVFEQYVLAELINNGDFERNINRIRRLRRKNRQNI
ncbi:MAG: PLP-dependent aminotransferase family protein [Oscillospiraceae bacterium]|nr:PLP-dependent aminotransferase family protein [Oscillospiraceae bacterium]